MKRYDVIKLISEASRERGVFDTPTETDRTVFCEVRSVGRDEFYRANAVGINVSIVFVLSLDAEYENEKFADYKGTRYRVVRTYVSDDGIELTCEVWNDGQPTSSTD